MKKILARIKRLFGNKKDKKTAAVDTAGLITVGFLILWVVCDWYAKMGPVVNTRFQDSFPPLLLLWVAICVANGLYSSKKPTKDDQA